MIIASKWFRPLPDFSVDQFAKVGSGLNRSATLSKALKKVNNLSNGRRIKFELDQTFVRLPFDFSFVLKEVGSCRNRLSTSSNSSNSARHSLDVGRMNVGQK